MATKKEKDFEVPINQPYHKCKKCGCIIFRIAKNPGNILLKTECYDCGDVTNYLVE